MTTTSEAAVVPPAVAGVRRAARGWAPWLVVVIALIVVAAVATPGFATGANLRAILQAAALTGIVAVTMTPLTMSGNLASLSTQQSAVLGAVLFAQLVTDGWNTPLAVLVVLGVVVLTGVVQGLVVAAGLNPIITTLAVGSMLAGIVAGTTQTTSISLTDRPLAWLGGTGPLGVPVPVLFFILVTAVVTWLMRSTVLGRRTQLSGANRATAALSGIPLRSTVIWAFVIVSAGAALAGVIGAAQVGYANSLLFSTMTFDVIAAVVVGGTAIRGGYGSPLWSAGGAVLISVINNLLLLHGLAYGVRIAIVGLLVVLSIAALQVLPGRRQP